MSTQSRKKRQPLETAAFCLMLAVIPRVPRKMLLAVARAAGLLGYVVDRSGREVGTANLDQVFGKDKNRREKKRILREAYVCMVRTVLDVFWFSHRAEERLNRYVELDESLNRLLCEKRQIFITAHYGNWEAAGQIMAIRGFPLHSIAMPVKNPHIDQILIRRREVTGQKIIPREGALRKMIGLLRKEGKIAFLVDQNTPAAEGGIWVDFFGLPAPVTAAPAALAAKTGTESLVGFSIPQPGGCCRVVVTGRIDPPSPDDPDAVHQITQQVQHLLEEQIRRYPEHWLWMYKRWRMVKPGTDPHAYPYYARQPRPDPRGRTQGTQRWNTTSGRVCL